MAAVSDPLWGHGKANDALGRCAAFTTGVAVGATPAPVTTCTTCGAVIASSASTTAFTTSVADGAAPVLAAACTTCVALVA